MAIVRLHLDKALITAARRTVNKLISKAKTVGVRETRTVYNIKAADLKNKIKVKRASINNMEAIIHVKGSHISFGKFSPTQTKRGAKVKIRKDRGRKLLRGSFIAQMQSGHVNVFYREGPKVTLTKGRYAGETRQKIKGKYTISPAHMFERAAVKAIDEMIKKDGSGIMQHEIEWELGKLNR